MEPAKANLTPQEIIELNKGVLLNIFEILIQDPSTPYKLHKPTRPPQFLGPNQKTETIAITPTNDQNHEFYIDKMSLDIPGYVDDSPCYRIWAADCGTWNETVKAMIPSEGLDAEEAKQISAIISISAPAIFLKAGPEVKKLFERFTLEFSRLEQGK